MLNNKAIESIQYLDTIITKIKEMRSNVFKEQYIFNKTSDIVIKLIELLIQLIEKDE